MVGLMAPEPRAMRELSRDEALRRLRSVALGRVVFTDRALPAIRPVNHLLDGERVVIRTHAGAAILSAAKRRVVVAYEADDIDPRSRLGWSVVVTGVASPVTDAVAAARYQELLRPWVSWSMGEIIAISAELVTGFELVAPDRSRDYAQAEESTWRNEPG